MHAALPLNEKQRFKPRNSGFFQLKQSLRCGAVRLNTRRFVLGALLLVFLVYNLFFQASGILNPWNTGARRPAYDAVTPKSVEYFDRPMYYPDIATLEDYRRDGKIAVSLADGSAGSAADKQRVLGSELSLVYRGTTSPRVVLVVGLDASGSSAEYLNEIIADRKEYAQKHGYGLYARYLQDFATKDPANADKKTTVFSKVLLVHEAMFAFPRAEWMWYLDQDAVITNKAYDVEQTLLSLDKLESVMVRGVPVVPPESIIHTYRMVPAKQIRFIVTMNDRGLSTSSFFVTNDDTYGHVLMSYWSDPLHRSYRGFNNQKGYNRPVDASLTHMAQWHPALLSRMAVIPHQFLGAGKSDGLVLQGQKFTDQCHVYLLHETNEVDPPDQAILLSEFRRVKHELADGEGGTSG